MGFMQTHRSFAELPLFPLKTVLFPGGYLPLQIFEVRYLDMVTRCHATQTPFAVVTLTAGDEVLHSPAVQGTANPTLFHPVGTLAHIAQLERPQPGLIWIRCTGGQRVDLSNPHPLKHGLWVALAQVRAADPVLPIPADLLWVQRTLQRVVDTLKVQGTPEHHMPIQPPYQWDDCAWLANRWCELLPMDLDQRQRLMTLDNPLIRLELVADLMQQNGMDPDSAATSDGA
ncbi:MAG: LON peptidase substrate-binding domain-containing protein [Rhodoferax sp.]